MENPNENVMDAVNAALGEVSGDSNADDTSAGGEEADAGTGDALDESGDAPAGEEGEAEGDAEGDAEGEGEEAPAGINNRRADGTFKSKAEIAAETAAKGAKPGEAAKPGEVKPQGAKQPDPLNDPIPKELKQETQDRIRSLVGMTREANAARETAESDMGFIVTGIQASGASPDQYGETLSWLSLFNSNDPAQQQQALEIVETVAERLATMLGTERKLSDPLSKHADLMQEVSQGKLTQARALEIARTRNSSAFRTELHTTAQQTTQQQQEQYARDVTQAKADLNDLEATLKAADPQYATKRQKLIAKLKPEFARLPPSQWAARFRQEYRTIKSAPVQRQSQVPNNQPLRPRGGNMAAGGSGSNMQQGPKTAREAIDMALSKVGG